MKSLLLALFAAFAFPVAATAADASSGQPSSSEAPFVTSASADLTARFPTPDAAAKAGYIRFTDEDDTGAISYANRQWTSSDPAHPSQLWYDVGGHLIGADFSVLQADSPSAPALWSVDPSRWTKIGAHVHFGLVGPNGTTLYGGAGAKTMAKGAASVEHPTASALVSAGVAKKLSDVRFVFAFPAIWDLQMWVVPNPNGAFAANNPNVTPAHTPKPASGGMGH